MSGTNTGLNIFPLPATNCRFRQQLPGYGPDQKTQRLVYLGGRRTVALTIVAWYLISNFAPFLPMREVKLG